MGGSKGRQTDILDSRSSKLHFEHHQVNPLRPWKNVKYIPYRSQIWVRVVSFICRKSISLTALIKHWNNYIRIYTKPPGKEFVCVFSLHSLSFNRWPELSHELSWHFVYLSIHFLCQKRFATLEGNKEKTITSSCFLLWHPWGKCVKMVKCLSFLTWWWKEGKKCLFQMPTIQPRSCLAIINVAQGSWGK